jgi:hypothetical protein
MREPALKCAAFSEQVEICEHLIESGAEVNLESESGMTALHVIDGPFGDDPLATLALAALFVRNGASPSHRPAALAQGSGCGCWQQLGSRPILHRRVRRRPCQLAADGRTMLETARKDEMKQVLRAALTQQAVASSMDTCELTARTRDGHTRAPAPL